jgi:signal transduction histidine kinase
MKRIAVQGQQDGRGRLFSIIAGQAVFWIMPFARLLMSALVFAWVSSVNPTGNSFASFVPLFLYAWLGWTAATTFAALAGQPFQIGICRAVVATDGILSITSIALMKGQEGATLAFGLCVIIFAMGIRVGRNLVFLFFMIWPAGFVLRDLAIVALGFELSRIEIASVGPELIAAALQILAIIALILWGNRRYILEKFTNDFSSLRMLSLERSFEFDLQSWTMQLALLFGPARAACLMAPARMNSASRYYHHDLPDWLNDAQREELMLSFGQIPEGCSIFDCDQNEIISPGSRTFRPFDDAEQRLALILRRANISAALVQPMHIDRLRGGVVCAVQRPIDAAKVAEAFYIGRHITEMSDFLSRIAAAERNFIADAHDVARRDLHDGVLQSLAALRMRMLLLAKRKDVAKTAVEHEIRKTVDIVTLEQSRLRGFLETSESNDHTVNLVSQLDISVRSISLQWNISVLMNSDVPAIPIDPESSINIEHLLREVIANAVRHAKSKSLTVSLSLKQDALMIAVTDVSPLSEGAQGYEKPALTLKSASLRDRLRLVNGEAYAEGLGKGTLLSIRIPMQQVDDA